MARRPSARLSLIAFAIFVTTSVGCSRSGPVHSRVCAEWVLLRFIDQLDGESAGFILPVQSRPFELQDVFRQGRFVNSEDDVVDEELAALPDSADLPSMLARDTENYFEVRRANPTDMTLAAQSGGQGGFPVSPGSSPSDQMQQMMAQSLGAKMPVMNPGQTPSNMPREAVSAAAGA